MNKKRKRNIGLTENRFGINQNTNDVCVLDAFRLIYPMVLHIVLNDCEICVYIGVYRLCIGFWFFFSCERFVINTRSRENNILKSSLLLWCAIRIASFSRIRIASVNTRKLYRVRIDWSIDINNQNQLEIIL